MEFPDGETGGSYKDGGAHPQETCDVPAEPQGLCVWTQEMLSFLHLKAVTRSCKAPNEC